MKILLAPHGTRGDVQPMIALARGLHARGHFVRFVAPANFVEWIRGCGFACESDGIDVEAVLRSPGADLNSPRWQLRHFRTVLAPRLFDAVGRASAGADLIVGAGVQLAAASVAELRAVPCATALFCPCAVPSSSAPPPNVPTQKLPRWLNRLLWRAGRPVADALLRRMVNDGRALLGLPPVRSPFALFASAGVVVAADPDLAPLGTDAPAHVAQTPAWIYEDATPLEPSVADFIRDGSPPIYVGFGSMVAADGDRLASSVVEACRACGCRAIVSAGWAALDARVRASDSILPVGDAPHAALFPHVAAVVHHGGAGTTTSAARAGVPQVVLPHLLDQHYWGHRIEALGLGPKALRVTRVRASALAERIDRVLRDGRFRQRAQELRKELAGRDGVGAAVNYLEELAAHCRT